MVVDSNPDDAQGASAAERARLPQAEPKRRRVPRRRCDRPLDRGLQTRVLAAQEHQRQMHERRVHPTPKPRHSGLQCAFFPTEGRAPLFRQLQRDK